MEYKAYIATFLYHECCNKIIIFYLLYIMCFMLNFIHLSKLKSVYIFCYISWFIFANMEITY